MNYYISDMHLGHNNVLRFDNRPFASVEEMDRMLIEYWNMRVREDDHVYIIGDFCYKSAYAPEYYLSRLKGHKHLIIGNHDGAIMKSPNAQSYFESIDKILRISDEGRGVVLCHFPIADWEARHHGSMHIYGHIHGRDIACMRFLKSRGPAYNAAACINNYMPCKFDEIIANNEAYLQWWKLRTMLTFNFNRKAVEEAGITTDELLEDMRSYAKECGIDEIAYGVFTAAGEDSMAMLIGYAVRKGKDDPGFIDLLDSWIANVDGSVEDCKKSIEEIRAKKRM